MPPPKADSKNTIARCARFESISKILPKLKNA